MKNIARKICEKLLNQAGIEINGSQPHDIQIHNEATFSKVLIEGRLGLGDSYVDGWWDAPDLVQFFQKLLQAGLDKKINKGIQLLTTPAQVIFNKQSRRRAWQVGEAHYDLGNDLFRAMLDDRMVYTCGYWKNANTLKEAQEAKLDLVCRKLNLKPGQQILDIGCGWGSFMKYAVEKYGVKAAGVTVSKEQIELGKRLCAGLPIEFILDDYRNIKGKYDHVISIGMFEGVGPKNYKKFFEVANDCLKDDGLFLLHTIGHGRSVRTTDPWIAQIFPNGVIPSLRQITKAIEGRFNMIDLHTFGRDYYLTLLSWFENFDREWESLHPQYGDRFYRFWKYYLLICAASFLAGKKDLWQVVLTKTDKPVVGYVPVQ